MSAGEAHPGRRILVTGAGRGIGRAAALRFAAGGAQVLGVARTESDLQALAREADVEILPASIGDADGCRRVASEAVRRLGGVDVLVHCAGVDTHRERPIWDQDDGVWNDTMTVNAWASFELTRLLARPMTERCWGRIVMVSSTAGAIGAAANTAYIASKHAVIGLMRGVAADVAPFGVTCNAVLPGWVRGTGMSDRSMQLIAEQEQITVDEVWERIEAETPARKIVRPEDVAATIAFLASDDAGAITGEAIRVAHGSLW